MPHFAFVITDASGAERTMRRQFELSVDAIRYARVMREPGGQVSVGEAGGAEISWLGCWSDGATGDAWEPAE